MGRTQNFFYLIHLYWVCGVGKTRDALFCPKPLVCVCLQSWAVSPGVRFKTQGNRELSGQVRSGESRLRPSYASDNFLLPRPVMRPAPEEHNGHTGFLKGPFLGPEESGVAQPTWQGTNPTFLLQNISEASDWWFSIDSFKYLCAYAPPCLVFPGIA